MKISISIALLARNLTLLILFLVNFAGDLFSQEAARTSNSQTVMDMLERKLEKDKRKANHVFASLTPLLSLSGEQIDEMTTTLDTVSQLMRLEMAKRAIAADTDAQVFSQLVSEINRGKVSLLARPEFHEVVKGILELEQYDKLQTWQKGLTVEVNRAAVDYVLAELATQIVLDADQTETLRAFLQQLVLVEPEGFQWRGAVTNVVMRLQHNLQQQYLDARSELAKLLTAEQLQILQDSNQGGDPTLLPLSNE